jgi:4-amino-4-deoxy-L-arabinose transferase-like glycosyltransferase
MSTRHFFLSALLVSVLGLSAVSFSLRGPSFRAHPADEIVYIRYAVFLKEQGLGAYPRLIDAYVRDPGNRIAAMSSPLKAGFLVPASVLTRFFRDGFAALACMSLAAYAVAVWCVAFFLKKEYGASTALLTACSVAFSPLVMAMARRALTESLFLCVCLLAIWAFTGYLRSGRMKFALCAGFLLGWATLIKETALLVAVSFLAYLLYRSGVLKKYARVSGLVFFCALPVAAAVAVMFMLGDPRQVLEILSLNLFSLVRETNLYDVTFCSGPWYRPLMDFIMLSPGVFLLGTGYFFVHLARHDSRGETMTFLAFLAVILITALIPYSRNVRYAILLDLPLRLGTVLMLRELFGTTFRAPAWSVPAAGIFLIAMTDYARFWDFFVANGIYDPVTPLFLRALRIIP